MAMERINPRELACPSGFSHAVSAPAGRMVFLAGQIGMDRDGKVAGGGIVPQFEQALANLLTALAAAGAPGPTRPTRTPCLLPSRAEHRPRKNEHVVRTCAGGV